MGIVERDCGWRTGLGTCFYNRLEQARRLSRLLDRLSCIVLLGPRNVGKSELARYTLLRVKGVHPLIIDARRLVARHAPPLPRELAERLVEAVVERAGLGRLVGILREATGLLKDRVVLVDEFHLLGGEPLRELEALCKALTFYREYSGWRLVATASEGWVLASRLESRLVGYGAWVETVEGLDEAHMRGLHGEYGETRGCSVGFEAYWRLVGGAPGYLPELCSLDERGIRVWVSRRVEELLRALLDAAKPGESLQEVAEMAYTLLVEERPAADKRLLELGDRLTYSNIAYPAGGLRYRPQLNVYRVILELWLEKGQPPTPEEVYRSVEGR